MFSKKEVDWVNKSSKKTQLSFQNIEVLEPMWKFSFLIDPRTIAFLNFWNILMASRDIIQKYPNELNEKKNLDYFHN